MGRARTVAGAMMIVIILGATGCGGNGTGPGGTDGQLSGTWHFERTMHSTMDDTCHASGVVTITQVGQTFTGDVSNSAEECTGTASASGGDDDDGPLTSGVVTEETVTFLQPKGECTYLGSAPSEPVRSMDGDVTCTEGTGAPHYWWTGEWTLKR